MAETKIEGEIREGLLVTGLLFSESKRTEPDEDFEDELQDEFGDDED